MANKHLSVKVGFVPQLHGVELVPPESPPSWSTGTDAQIAEALAKHYAGNINLHEYWNVGDTRTIHLSAMAATGANGVRESHVEQDVEFQIVNAGGKELANGTECAFIVQLKNVLTNNSNQAENGYMNPLDSSVGAGLNVGGWKECKRRIWCNTIFRDSLPESARSLFKLHKNMTSQGNALTTLDETEDYFAFPAFYNVFGKVYNSPAVDGEDTIRWSYYDTEGNRKKYPKNNATPRPYWFRSPYKDNKYSFCCSGNSSNVYSTKTAEDVYTGFAPFGCI